MANERQAQTYAQAMHDELIDSWLKPLKAIARSLAGSDTAPKLDDAGLPLAKKQELVKPLVPADADTRVKNLISLLASKNEVYLLPQIIQEFEHLSRQAAFSRFAVVTSVIALSEAERQKLETRLRAQFGQDLRFEYKIDPEILGGVVVRIGDKVIDGSVAGKLAALKEKLK